MNRIAEAITFVTQELSGVGGWLRDQLVSIITKGAGIAGNIAAGLGEIGKWVGRAIIDGLKGALGTGKDIANAFIDFLNAILGRIKIKGPGPLPDLNFPDHLIPKLAQGGVALRPTLAEIGHGALGEAVLPLSGAVMRSLGNAIAMAMPAPALAGTAGLRSLTGAQGGLGSFEQHNHFPPAPGGEFPDIAVVSAQLAQAARGLGLRHG